MDYVLSSREMKQWDSAAIHEKGIPSMVLMERAALAVVREVKICLEKERQSRNDTPSVLLLCGSGNNGGDGFAAARLLMLDGIHTEVWFVGRESSLTEETRQQKKIYENYGGIFCRNPKPDEYTVIVDALFGIGLSRPVTGACEEAIRLINGAGRPVVAVDLPSGISADTGEVLGCAIRSSVTVCFAYPKIGALLYPGAEFCGDLKVADIGIYCESGNTFTYEKTDLSRLPVRKPRANKGTYGKVLLIGGGENMAGAALLAAKAAYRTGCGLVQVLAAESSRVPIQTHLPEAVFASWDQDQALELRLPWADAVGIGPGLGTSQEARELLKKVLLLWKGPLLLDADGLNILSECPEYLSNTEAKILVTPHPGEMARLEGREVKEILENLLKTAGTYANTHQSVCVLKDARTVVSDGRRQFVNTSGNEGMAVGGSGDVLTGIITSLLAQGMEPFEAACLGVYLHGLAGDAAKDSLGSRSMLAGDIVNGISEVLGKLED